MWPKRKNEWEKQAKQLIKERGAADALLYCRKIQIEYQIQAEEIKKKWMDEYMVNRKLHDEWRKIATIIENLK